MYSHSRSSERAAKRGATWRERMRSDSKGVCKSFRATAINDPNLSTVMLESVEILKYEVLKA